MGITMSPVNFCCVGRCEMNTFVAESCSTRAAEFKTRSICNVSFTLSRGQWASTGIWAWFLREIKRKTVQGSVPPAQPFKIRHFPAPLTDPFKRNTFEDSLWWHLFIFTPLYGHYDFSRRSRPYYCLLPPVYCPCDRSKSHFSDFICHNRLILDFREELSSLLLHSVHKIIAYRTIKCK